MAIYLDPIQRKVLTEINASQNGEIGIDDLRELYSYPRRDSVMIGKLVMQGALEWSRRSQSGKANAIRITDRGRALANLVLEECND